VAVNSDAHIATDIGRFDLSLMLFALLDFSEELIANRNAASFREALAAAGL
jgi:putative hydrolase